MDRDIFERLCAEFLEFLQFERGLSGNTLRAYKADLFALRQFYTDCMRDAIGHYFIWAYHRGITKVSLARKISTWRMFEIYCTRNNIVLDLRLKPMRGIYNKPIRPVSYEKITHILDGYHKSKRNKAIMEMLYATGMRVSELSNARLNNINWHDKLILINGKGNRERYCLFNNNARQSLEDYIKTERGRSLCPHIFLNYRGTKLTCRSIRRVVVSYRKHLENIKLTPHLIRHTFASHLYDNDADLRVLQELLGHAKLQTVERYTHVSNEKLRNKIISLHPISKIFKK